MNKEVNDLFLDLKAIFDNLILDKRKDIKVEKEKVHEFLNVYSIKYKDLSVLKLSELNMTDNSKYFILRFLYQNLEFSNTYLFKHDGSIRVDNALSINKDNYKFNSYHTTKEVNNYLIKFYRRLLGGGFNDLSYFIND